MTPLRLFAAGIALAGSFASPGLAQPPAGQRSQAPELPALGSEAFRGLFRFHNVKPVQPFQITDRDYADLIVVVLGHPGSRRAGSVDPAPIAQKALRNGGAVLVAIEGAASLSGYFPALTNVGVTGALVTNSDGQYVYNNQPNCPLVVPRPPSDLEKLLWQVDAPASEWGLFLGIDRLATNVPGVLEVRSESRYVRSKLAGYPPASRAGKVALAPNSLFAVAGSGREDSPFRCLVLADPSVFSNQMMAPPPGWPANDNVVFADRVVQWLRGPNDRSKCLFVENGYPRTDFDVVRYEALQGMPPIPVPPLPDPLDPELQRKVTDAANRWIARVQDNDSLHHAFAGSDGRFYRVTRFLAAVAALVLLVLLVRRAWRGRHEPDVPPVPTDTGRVAGTAPAGSLARRREEILQAGDYGTVVREYLQELFISQGLPETVAPPRKLPEVRVKGPGSTTLRENLRILWDVTFGPRPRPVSYGRWKELEPMIDAVRRAAADGRWRFADTGETA